MNRRIALKISILYLLSMLFSVGTSLGQSPNAFTQAVEPLEYVEKIIPEPPDFERIALEDQVRDQEGVPYRFAVDRSYTITPLSSGTWEELDNNRFLWRQRINSPGVVSINLGFSRYKLPQGSDLFIYSSDGEQIVGPFTEEDNEIHGQLWTPVIQADDIIVELTIPVSELENVDLELTSINLGYRGFMPLPKEKGIGDSGSCNVNVACSEGDGWRDQIRSVAMYTVSGLYQCTGTLINNTAEDDTPYFLSAYHCNVDSGTASSVVVYWNYEASTCKGTTAPMTNTQTGSYFRARYSSSDFVLIELDDMPAPSFNVYYSGWDRSSIAPSSGVAIHHPQGDMKKISFEYQPLSVTSYLDFTPNDGTHLRVADWDHSGEDEGTTETGSSGCPIFNSSKRVTGTLHGGYAACGNDESDWFGRFYTSWTGGGTSSTRLRNWLDPISTGALTLNGKDPEYEIICTPTEDFETGDFSSSMWVHSGNADWVITSLENNSGIYSAKAGTISHNQSTSLKVTLDCIAGDIRFYRKVSSESSYDYLDFYIDGILKGSWSGTYAWSQQSYPVSAGVRTFKWTYSKDGSVSSGSDTAWIDDIEFPVDCDDCCAMIITSYPYMESFETGLGEWIDSTNDDFDWTRNSGSTTSSGTGPSAAYDGSYYVYTEASSPNYPLKTAIFEGPCFDLSSLDNPELRFWYHMYGVNMGTLSVEVSDDDCSTWNNEWTISGNQGNNWYRQIVDLSSYSGSVIKIRFKGVTGSSFESDMAVDNIKVYDGLIADFNKDDIVNHPDFGILSQQWLNSPGTPSADIAPDGGDNMVDFLDFAVFADNWLKEIQL